MSTSANAPLDILSWTQSVESASTLDQLGALGREALTLQTRLALGNDWPTAAFISQLWLSTQWITACGRDAMRGGRGFLTPEQVQSIQLDVARRWLLTLGPVSNQTRLFARLDRFESEAATIFLSPEILSQRAPTGTRAHLMPPFIQFCGGGAFRLATFQRDVAWNFFESQSSEERDEWTASSFFWASLGRAQSKEALFTLRDNSSFGSFPQETPLAFCPTALLDQTWAAASSLSSAELAAPPGVELARRFSFDYFSHSPALGAFLGRASARVLSDGFLALAERLQIPPASLSLDQLGVRANQVSNNFLAYFSPTYEELGFTFPPSSIAHEWTHALESEINRNAPSGTSLAKKALRSALADLHAAIVPPGESTQRKQPAVKNFADLARMTAAKTAQQNSAEPFARERALYFSEIAKTHHIPFAPASSLTPDKNSHASLPEAELRGEYFQTQIGEISASALAGSPLPLLAERAARLADLARPLNATQASWAVHIVSHAENLSQFFAFAAQRRAWGPFHLEAARRDGDHAGGSGSRDGYWTSPVEKLARTVESFFHDPAQPQLGPYCGSGRAWTTPTGEEQTSLRVPVDRFLAAARPFLIAFAPAQTTSPATIHAAAVSAQFDAADFEQALSARRAELSLSNGQPTRTAPASSPPPRGRFAGTHKKRQP